MIICLDPLDGSVCLFVVRKEKKKKLGKMAIIDHETIPGGKVTTTEISATKRKHTKQ